MKVYAFRRWRSRWLGWEWHNHNGTTYFHVWWGHPRKHAWWAVALYFYLRTAS